MIRILIKMLFYADRKTQIVDVDVQGARTHMAGLGNMVIYGGGLDRIGVSPDVQEALFW